MTLSQSRLAATGDAPGISGAVAALRAVSCVLPARFPDCRQLSLTGRLPAGTSVSALTHAPARLALGGICAQQIVEVCVRALAIHARMDRGDELRLGDEHDWRAHLLVPPAEEVAEHVDLAGRRGLVAFGIRRWIRAAEALGAARADLRDEQRAEAVAGFGARTYVACDRCIGTRRRVA